MQKLEGRLVGCEVGFFSRGNLGGVIRRVIDGVTIDYLC